MCRSQSTQVLVRNLGVGSVIGRVYGFRSVTVKPVR
jgi:hypothetical protein